MLSLRQTNAPNECGEAANTGILLRTSLPVFLRRYSSPSAMRHVLISALLLSICSEAFAQEDLDFFPGLLAKYSTGPKSVERVDKTLSFDWGAAAPDERLAAGPFTAEWTGNLLVRVPGEHRFHVFVAGEASVQIDGEIVLEASHPWGFVTGEPVELRGGDHEIRVTYSAPQEADKPRARLSVYWSSTAFTLEPLPADVLFREESSTEVWAAEHGQLLMDAHRCAACHRSDSEATLLEAPALDRVAGSQDIDTLVERIWRPQNVVPNSHMPSFDLAPAEAESVAAFLLSISRKAHPERQPKFKEGDADTGAKLLISLGCVACHEVPGGLEEQRTLAAPYDAPTLTGIQSRRSPAWLDRWLKDPASLNTDHRMPVFDLSNDERRQLVAALATNNKTPNGESSFVRQPQEPTGEVIAAGRRIVEEANCAACHRIPGITPKLNAALTAKSFGNSRGDCLNPVDIPNLRSKAGQRVPSFYAFLNADNKQRADDDRITDSEMVRQWISSFPEGASTANGLVDGSMLLKRNGCTACHDRNQNNGLSSIASQLQKLHPALDGRSQGLVPPSLTAVGDKLQDHYLKTAVAGEQKTRRLPWLLIRMPKFRHSDSERAALLRHFITSDRIPDEADPARQDVLAHIDVTGKETATPEDLLLGNQLAGAGGFNCVACHKAGEFEPRNVALGTRGSDIMTMGSRLRPRFFQRWMKNPIRVVAGIEMPAIKRGVPGVLNDSLPAQIGLLWKALSDERFIPPTVTSRFEQVVNVGPDESPRIIRDVFTIGTGKERIPVARAMAIGFPNRHNLLIDLDTMSIRLWTYGEFARQRTEGKSWYWDLPGTVVHQQQNNENPLTMSVDDKQASLTAVVDENRHSELVSYHVNDDAVELVTRTWFDLSGSGASPSQQSDPHSAITAWNDPNRNLHPVTVKYTFRAPRKDGAAWVREVEISDEPADALFTLQSPIAAGVPGKEFTGGVYSTGLARPAADQPLKDVSSVELQLPAIPATKAPVAPPIIADAEPITSTPGFNGSRLPIDASIMPTAMAWLPDGRMAFTSLKGHVWIATDTNGDGLPDSTELFEEGLAAPFGIITENDGSIIVSHKPEILRLRDTDGDGRADARTVVASGWGFNDNYHDWTSGLVRDKSGNLFAGLGSDYAQKNRPTSQDRWRGGIIRVSPAGDISPMGMSMRYPMGLAFDGNGNLFATDNQGVQNTFNEINHIIEGKHYGVPSRHQPTENLQHETPAVMVPHPWQRQQHRLSTAKLSCG